MLVMSSASIGTGPAPRAEDLTARARIRDAAIERFARDGVARTSVRAIAEEAAVSPPLVLHHFGSKDKLRIACDEHVAGLVRDQKRAAMAAGTGLDPLSALRGQQDGPPVLRYLACTLIDGSPHVAELVDEMVADAVGYMAEGERSGLLEPTGDAHGRAAVLTLWSLGALVLHEHAERLLGVDLLGDPAQATRYLLPALEILGRGVLRDDAYEHLCTAMRDQQGGSA
jgi:AcrR family transcriptional regulator